MSSQSGVAGEIFIFESEKRHGIQPLKMDTLTVSDFNAFIHIHDKSKPYLSHQFVLGGSVKLVCTSECPL